MNPDLVFERMSEQWREKQIQEMLASAMQAVHFRNKSKFNYSYDGIIRINADEYLMLLNEIHEVRNEQEAHRKGHTISP